MLASKELQNHREFAPHIPEVLAGPVMSRDPKESAVRPSSRRFDAFAVVALILVALSCAASVAVMWNGPITTSESGTYLSAAQNQT
jgi:hypothetical protein